MATKKVKGSRQSTKQSLAFQQTQIVPHPSTFPSTSSSRLWTDEELNILRENKCYFEKMIKVADKAEREGPQKLPKKPQKSLLHLFKEKEGKKESKKEMTDFELHSYLATNRADVETAITREMFSENLFSETFDEDEIVTRLQKGVKNVKKQDAQTLMIYIQFGNFLNLCKNWFDQKKKHGGMEQNWEQWLKEKCDYSADHARKLRAIAKVLYGFPQFFTVGLPLRYISGKLKQINSMLQVPELREFWSQSLALPATDDLPSSQ